MQNARNLQFQWSSDDQSMDLGSTLTRYFDKPMFQLGRMAKLECDRIYPLNPKPIPRMGPKNPIKAWEDIGQGPGSK
jgi:hypothetical protein